MYHEEKNILISNPYRAYYSDRIPMYIPHDIILINSYVVKDNKTVIIEIKSKNKFEITYLLI